MNRTWSIIKSFYLQIPCFDIFESFATSSFIHLNKVLYKFKKMHLFQYRNHQRMDQTSSKYEVDEKLWMTNALTSYFAQCLLLIPTWLIVQIILKPNLIPTHG